MLRTAARALAVATLAAVLLVPAVPAAAAPSDSGGWAAALLDAIAGWLPTFGRVTASDGGEALPNLDPNGLAAGPQGSPTSEGGEAYPNLDPDGLSAGPGGPQSQTTEGEEDTYPNIDPNG